MDSFFLSLQEFSNYQAQSHIPLQRGTSSVVPRDYCKTFL